MIIQDDRTDDQKKTHQWLVVGTDSFMSGWGEAKGMVSYAAWATTQEGLNDTLCWVERRGDMKRIRVVYGDYKPKGKVHLHIYVSKQGKQS